MLEQEVCANEPTEIVEQLGEALSRLDPKLSFLYDVDSDGNPTLTVKRNITREERKVRVRFNAATRRFDVAHGEEDYTESTSMVKTALFLVNTSFVVEPEGF